MPSTITLEDVNGIVENVGGSVDPSTSLQEGGPKGKSPITVDDVDAIILESQQGSDAYLGQGDRS